MPFQLNGRLLNVVLQLRQLRDTSLFFRPALDDVRARRTVAGAVADHKSALQEWLQANGQPLPDYHLAGVQGPDHQKVFTVEVRVGSQAVGTADGRSKKEAEQKAASRALEALNKP